MCNMLNIADVLSYYLESTVMYLRVFVIVIAFLLVFMLFHFRVAFTSSVINSGLF